MSSVTFYAAVPFNRTDKGELVLGETRECVSRVEARRTAKCMVTTHAGAIAFSRTAELANGDLHDARLIAFYGTIDLKAMRRRAPLTPFVPS